MTITTGCTTGGTCAKPDDNLNPEANVCFKRSIRWTPLLLVALLAPATPAAAQSYADVVWTQLKAAYQVADNNGYSVRNYIIGKLNQDDTDTWTLTFYPGSDYMIVGACDGDCVDIDLVLYENELGLEVDSDTSRDDTPIVRVTPDVQEDFSIEVGMYECTAEPCYFGLAIFYK